MKKWSTTPVLIVEKAVNLREKKRHTATCWPEITSDTQTNLAVVDPYHGGDGEPSIVCRERLCDAYGVTKRP